jgi:hypothetical protein
MLDRSCQVSRAPLAEHPDDCYDTPAVAVHALLNAERLPHRVWENACGKGNIVKVLREAGHDVVATDITDRGCPDYQRYNFLTQRSMPKDRFDAIVTNPPFHAAERFVAISLQFAPLVIMLLRLAFLESVGRAYLLDRGQLARLHVFANRLPMMHRAGWTGKRASSAVPFAWFIFDRNHKGPTTIDRIVWEPLPSAAGTS